MPNTKTPARLLLILAALALLAALPGCDQAAGTSTGMGSSAAVSGEPSAESGSASGGEAVLPVKDYTKKDLNAEWAESGCTLITLSGDSAAVQGQGASADGSTVTITKAGDYLLTGTLNGQIIVNAEKTEDVRLILNGVRVTSPDSAAIWVQQADKVILTLAEGSENSFTDAAARDETLADIPNAAIYSKDDLSINGSGSLMVYGQYDHGIFTTNDLTITGGTTGVTAAGDGLKGKDSVAVQDGDITIDAGGDGIQSSETDDSADGWVRIDGGTFAITAAGDGIQAETVLYLADGNVSLTTGAGSAGEGAKADTQTGNFGGFGGGSGGRGNHGGTGGKGDRQNMEGVPAMPEGETPPEGISAPSGGETGGQLERPGTGGSMPALSDGEAAPPELPDGETGTPPAMAADSGMTAPADAGSTADDTVSTKGLKAGLLLQIDGGAVEADCYDDSVHSNGDVIVNGGTLRLATGDDGIHADDSLTIAGGEITVTRSYEGLEGQTVEISGGVIAVAATDDGINAGGGSDTTQPGGRPGQDTFSGSGSSIVISGGQITVDAGGDGIDSNGSLTFSGGTVLVAGPTDGGNGALDFDGSCTITGGALLAAGSSGMAEAPRDARQPTLKITFSENLEAGTPVALTDESGSVLCAFVSSKPYNSLVLSLPELEAGKTYRISTGGSVSGVPVAGTDSAFLYGGDSYEGGVQVQSFTLAEGVNNISA